MRSLLPLAICSTLTLPLHLSPRITSDHHPLLLSLHGSILKPTRKLVCEQYYNNDMQLTEIIQTTWSLYGHRTWTLFWMINNGSNYNQCHIWWTIIICWVTRNWRGLNQWGSSTWLQYKILSPYNAANFALDCFSWAKLVWEAETSPTAHSLVQELWSYVRLPRNQKNQFFIAKLNLSFPLHFHSCPHALRPLAFWFFLFPPLSLS